MTAPEQVQVTQADLNAAADLIEQYWSGADASMMRLARDTRNGHTQGVFPRALARHRIAAAADAMADAAEWKQQHENLLAVRQQDLSVLHERTELLRRALAYLPSTLGVTQDIRRSLTAAIATLEGDTK